MDLITLPLWQFAGAVASPCVILAMLITRLVRNKRRCRKKLAAARDGFHPVTAEAYENRIFQEMVSQQIDTVFNALIAVIEAERIKLKALLLRRKHPAPEAPGTMPAGDQVLSAQTEEIVPELNNIYRPDCGHADDPSEGLAGQGWLSRHEAALAMLLNNKTEKKRQSIKAVV